jgi:hypothetical protein
MQQQHLTTAAYAACGAGLLLIAISLIFPWFLPDRGAWSPANADEYSKAAAELYRLTHEHGHSHAAGGASSGVSEEQLQAARQRFAEQKQKLSSAVGGRHTMRSVFKWGGILLTAAGLAVAGALKYGVGA